MLGAPGVLVRIVMSIMVLDLTHVLLLHCHALTLLQQNTRVIMSAIRQLQIPW